MQIYYKLNRFFRSWRNTSALNEGYAFGAIFIHFEIFEKQHHSSNRSSAKNITPIKRTSITIGLNNLHLLISYKAEHNNIRRLITDKNSSKTHIIADCMIITPWKSSPGKWLLYMLDAYISIYPRKEDICAVPSNSWGRFNFMFIKRIGLFQVFFKWKSFHLRYKHQT